MLNISTIYRWGLTLVCLFILVGCNKEWTEEQYENYISFVNTGANAIRIKYAAEGGKVTSKIPVQVSGSTSPDRDIHVNVVVENDTIDMYNFENFRFREDLYFYPLDEKHYSFDPSVTIPKGKLTANLIVDFDFKGIDLYNKYFFSLCIDPSSDLSPNPRKYYKRSLIHIILFNDYSGVYSVSNEVEYESINAEGNTVREKLKVESRNSWVVDENTVFFYAGIIDEESLERKDYRVFMEFVPDEDSEIENAGSIKLRCENENIKFEWNPENCYYLIEVEDDPVQPFLQRRYVMINVDYSYLDISNPEIPLRYFYNGNMIMQRTYNTLMPEEDRIQW